MPQLALPILGSIGSGVIGSIFGSQPKTQTSTSTTSVNTPAALQPLQDATEQSLLKRMQDPTQGTDPVRLAGRTQINANYAGADQAVRDATGAAGATGKTGAGIRRTQNARAGALSGFDGSIASMILGREDNTMSLSQQLLKSMQGSTTTSTGTVPGNQTGAGLSSLSSGLGTLTTLMTLNHLLKGGGGSVNDNGVDPSMGSYGALPGITMPSLPGAPPVGSSY